VLERSRDSARTAYSPKNEQIVQKSCLAARELLTYPKTSKLCKLRMASPKKDKGDAAPEADECAHCL
jgi:hypothetical protein